MYVRHLNDFLRYISPNTSGMAGPDFYRSSSASLPDFRNIMDDVYFRYTILPGILIATLAIIFAVLVEVCCRGGNQHGGTMWNDESEDEERIRRARQYRRARRLRRERSMAPEPEERPER